MADFDLQGLLSQFGQVSDEEKRRAITQGLAAAGFGILGARGVNGMQAIGQGGLLGMNAYNGALDQAGQQQRQGLQSAMQAMQLKEGMQKFQDQDAFRKLQEGMVHPGVGTPASPQAPQAPQMAADGMGPPTEAPAAPVAAAPIQQTDGLARKRAMAEQLRAQAAQYSQSALPQAQAMAQSLMDRAEKILPKLKDQKTLTQNGKRVVVNLYDDGSHEVLADVAPDREKLSFQNTGGSIVGLDPYSGAPGSAPLATTVSPDSQLSANTLMRGQNMTDARAREFNANAAANGGQVVETATGFARIGKDNTVTPIVANGQQIQAKPTGAVQQQIATNNVTLQKIDRAMSLIDKHPDAFGLKNVVGDPIMQRVDPAGVAARSIVADIAGQKIHDRSGGAVSAGESERLKPYVPNVTDDPDVVKTKLANFKREYQQMQKELAGGASVADVSAPRGSGATAGWTVKRVN